MKHFKASGVALPIFSLPDDYGIGTIGKGARLFIDFLHDSGFSYWSILPLGPTSFLDSPYQSTGSKALNPYFIDLEDLKEKGLLESRDLNSIDWGQDKRRVDYGKIYANRMNVLRIAYKRFLKGKGGKYQRGYTSFIRQSTNFYDYACYISLKEKFGGVAWRDFPEPYNSYSPALFRKVKKENLDDVLFHLWTQYIFLRQWDSLRDYAKEKEVTIIGDLPMHVAYDSVDVYRHPKNFLLGKGYKMEESAGYPPDVFYDKGQAWGFPLYDFSYQKKNGYRFLKGRLDFALSLYDVFVFDHFRGILENYHIPEGNQDGLNGRWEEGPGEDFLDTVKLPSNRFICEDVDFHSEKMSKILDRYRLSDMRVLEFAFPREKGNFNKPSNYPYPCCSFSSTHDCLPLVAYFDSLPFEEKIRALGELNSLSFHFGVRESTSEANDMSRAVLELNLAGSSKIAIQNMPDLLHQGKEGRINDPSHAQGNWTYRISEEDLSKKLSKELLEKNQFYGRI